jgi:tRNA dimethylallyltransferase
MLRPVIAVVGPTAAGKSDLSLELARALDADVINADSMQLYQGMSVSVRNRHAETKAMMPIGTLT